MRALMTKNDAQVTGNVGLYWVCYQLSRMGWNAMPTARNARGVAPGEVRALAHRGEKEGRVTYWLQPAAYCVEAYHEAWGRIGEPE